MPPAAASTSPRAPCCASAALEANRDYTIVEAPFPGMRAMLAEKKVDIIPTVLPFALDPELKKIAHPLFSITDAIGVSQFAMWAMRKPFIDKNRAAIVDFMEDTMRIERWYLDPKNHDAVAEIASRITKQPPERFGWLFTKSRLLPQSRDAARSRRVAEERRHDQGFGLRQSELRRQGAFRSQPDRGSGEAAEVNQCIDLPPSTLMVWPVMKSLAGDDRNITAPTRSAGTCTRSMARPATREAR